MSDLSLNPSTINLRSKGLTASMGKLHKGCVKDATTKLSIGSIPSAYESIIYKTDNKRAFGTSEKRFYDKSNVDTNQPNSQDVSTVESYQTQNKINHNKLGQNCFISKQKREWNRSIRTPGPTHYYRQQDKQLQTRPRKCFTRQCGKKQRKLLNLEKKEQINTPGPGQYIYENQKYWNTTYKGWKSSFQTKVSRDGYIPRTITPGPGFYRLTDSNVNQSNKQNQVNQANLADKQNLNKNAFLQQLSQNGKGDPGPGTYNHQIPNFKPLYEKIKMSANFMTPVFTGKKKYRGGPGPTAYPVKRMYDDLTPKLICSTFFMSETKRGIFAHKINDTTQINPEPMGHKNFHFNIKNEWMC